MRLDQLVMINFYLHTFINGNTQNKKFNFWSGIL